MPSVIAEQKLLYPHAMFDAIPTVIYVMPVLQNMCKPAPASVQVI